MGQVKRARASRSVLRESIERGISRAQSAFKRGDFSDSEFQEIAKRLRDFAETAQETLVGSFEESEGVCPATSIGIWPGWSLSTVCFVSHFYPWFDEWFRAKAYLSELCPTLVEIVDEP